MFYLPLSLFIVIFLLFHNFIIFPPHSWIPSSTILNFSHLLLIVDFPPLQFLLFSVLNLDFPPPPPPHLFYTFFHPQIHRPHIDPTSTLDSTFFQHCFVNSETLYNHHHISFFHHHHHISIVSLHHHYRHISIVFPPPPPPPPPPHFYCFHSFPLNYIWRKTVISAEERIFT